MRRTQGIPEENCLNLGEFGIGEDQGKPKAEVNRDRVSGVAEPLPNGEPIHRFFNRIGVVGVGSAEVLIVVCQQRNVPCLPCAHFGDIGDLWSQAASKVGEVFAGFPGFGKESQGFCPFIVIELSRNAARLRFTHPFEERFGFIAAATQEVDQKAPLLRCF